MRLFKGQRVATSVGRSIDAWLDPVIAGIASAPNLEEKSQVINPVMGVDALQERLRFTGSSDG